MAQYSSMLQIHTCTSHTHTHTHTHTQSLTKLGGLFLVLALGNLVQLVSTNKNSMYIDLTALKLGSSFFVVALSNLAQLVST